MALSRRRFLKVTIAASASIAAGYVGAKGLRPVLKRWLTEPDLPEDTPPGPLEEQVIRVLLATTETLINMPIETGHYKDFFIWRSENLRGYKGLYQQFAITVNIEARRAAGLDFINCDGETKRKILERALQAGKLDKKLDKVRRGIFDRKWVLFYRYIVRDIFALFARTDAYVVLGYETWPGTPIGLSYYRKKPVGNNPLKSAYTINR